MSESTDRIGELTNKLCRLDETTDEYGLPIILVQSVDNKLAQATGLIKEAQDALTIAAVDDALAAKVASVVKDEAAAVISKAKDDIIVQLRQDLKESVADLKNAVAEIAQTKEDAKK